VSDGAIQSDDFQLPCFVPEIHSNVVVIISASVDFAQRSIRRCMD